MARKLAKLYTTTKEVWRNREWHFIEGSGGTLFSEGRYPTKKRPEDLPDWYISGCYYYSSGFLCAKDVVDLVYVPNMLFNHMFKYDRLYVSYSGQIVPQQDREKSMIPYSGFDYSITGWSIVSFLKAAERYSGFDIDSIKKQIEQKRLWFKNTYPEDYRLEISADRPFFEEQ